MNQIQKNTKDYSRVKKSSLSVGVSNRELRDTLGLNSLIKLNKTLYTNECSRSTRVRKGGNVATGLHRRYISHIFSTFNLINLSLREYISSCPSEIATESPSRSPSEEP
jgi:hypothetical protein